MDNFVARLKFVLVQGGVRGFLVALVLSEAVAIGIAFMASLMDGMIGLGGFHTFFIILLNGQLFGVLPAVIAGLLLGLIVAFALLFVKELTQDNASWLGATLCLVSFSVLIGYAVLRDYPNRLSFLNEIVTTPFGSLVGLFVVPAFLAAIWSARVISRKLPVGLLWVRLLSTRLLKGVFAVTAAFDLVLMAVGYWWPTLSGWL